MHYVKHFKINGVDTKQVACIELQGAPNAATEGAVGVLGMDMTSPTHEVYRCVAVNGSVYTWELLSAGMSIISATITGEGGESMSFPYNKLRIPNNYLIKPGDLILDSKGYLYQISSIGAESCDTTYCGTHIGGIASGDKDYQLVVSNGKLQLMTESGNVISNVDYLSADGDTIYRNPSNGKASVLGMKTINDKHLRLFVGTKGEYNALTESQKRNLFAIITDDNARKIVDDLHEDMGEVITRLDYLEPRVDALETKKKYLHQISISFEQGSVLSVVGFNYVTKYRTPFTTVTSIGGALYEDEKTIPASGVINSKTVCRVLGAADATLGIVNSDHSIVYMDEQYLESINDNVEPIMGGE